MIEQRSDFDDEMTITSINDSICWYYILIDDYLTALHYCQKLLLIYKRFKSNNKQHYIEGYVKTCGRLGLILYKLDDYIESFTYCIKSINTYNDCLKSLYIVLNTAIADVYAILADIYFKFNEISLAYNCYLEALKLFHRNTDPDSLSHKGIKRVHKLLKQLKHMN
ncbi:unnamed protein product [Didymodactylos carnosus]|uniref:Tetratricopeptide repeat protein n=1 Tax=Didymodactylos carnosus TaxID=1234261 RepID=A0A815F619_9BILA|nr:unnamed protein product [Didymodactylos carnosus]CAF4167046.1 unnamed protein product [Didymodactylos carnosus]